MVDITLEKGKGLVLGKLRTITLIEGNLQIMMQRSLSATENEIIEDDNRFSKANYELRRNFLIEIAILEKRLILDNSIISMKPTIYNLIDLQSCYDWQLVNVESIVEESSDRDQNAMKLFTKIIPKFKYYISTRFRISTRYYGGEENLLAGTSQGNKFFGNIYRDISCLIIIFLLYQFYTFLCIQSVGL